MECFKSNKPGFRSMKEEWKAPIRNEYQTIAPGTLRIVICHL